MVEKRMHIVFNGITYEPKIRFRVKDWKSSLVMEQLQIKDPTWLVQYDKHRNCATVDKDAPTWYIELATLHEMICVGGLYEDIVNKALRNGIEEGIHRWPCKLELLVEGHAVLTVHFHEVDRCTCLLHLRNPVLGEFGFHHRVFATLQH